jgi:two-component system cell cycle response regulator
MTFIQTTDQIFAPTSISGEDNIHKLKATLSALINKVKQNEETQSKFHKLELHFLRANSLSTLYTRLLTELNERFDLEQVELILVDKNNEVQGLLKDIYGELNFENLSYVTTQKAIETLYLENKHLGNKLDGKEYHIALTQDEAEIAQIFTYTKRLPKSAVKLPLTKNGELIGSLHLGSHNIGRFTPGLATNFLAHLGAVVSICIENAMNQEQFKLLSLVDLLTRTKNRRYFVQSITREIARASRSTTSLSCLFLDLDHFKSVNDTYGHLTGDRALQSVAKAIKPLLRQSDVLSRFGGEEFTVMLPETDQSHAKEIAERIRNNISQIIIKDDYGQDFKVTVSIGVSTWSPNNAERMSFEEVQNYLIKKADEGVYLAKKSGRNCVKIAT